MHSSNDQSYKRGMVRRVLAAAGRAVGRSQASERGTVLLMVIGVLAMMSIIALVYASIGQADRRSAASLAKESRIDDQSQTVADYIAGVIAGDLFSFHQVRYTGQSQDTLYREVTDYPSSSSDPSIVSEITGGGQFLFEPIGYDGFDPWLASTEPGYIPISGRPVRTPGYLNQEDWLHISNLSPNGRFVNLAALRNNFKAEPGIGLDATNRPRMSERLTLFGAADGRAQTATGPQRKPDGQNADKNVPADWTANQIYLHRPAHDLDQRAGAPEPGQFEYVLNQYADADGDGMLDSRWWELVGRDPNNGTMLFPAIQAVGPARLFVASRVIDLSGLVNVNTALEFRLRPDKARPVGLTPADVDLRRLLRMQDFYDHPFYDNLAYDGYEPVPLLAQSWQYGGGYDEMVASALGAAGFEALWRARLHGPIPPQGQLRDPDTPSQITAQTRAEQFFRFGLNPFGGDATGSGLSNRWLGRPFGISDEVELRAFHGANDASTYSRFEAAVDGRFFTGETPEDRGPLRSNRPFQFERGGRGDFYPAGQTAPHASRDGRADDEALLQAMTDIRRLLTFYSGSRLLRPVEVTPGATVDSLSAADLRLDIDDVLDTISGGGANAEAELRKLFGVYATSLAPYLESDRTNIWAPTNSTTFRQYAPLSYGGRGPQLALEFAAHMVANTVDMYDMANPQPGDDPTALIVKFRSGGPAPVVPTGHTLVDLDTIDVPGSGVALRLDPTLPNAATEARIYGIEAQPFMTEVAAFHVFTDAPTAWGGDVDWAWTDRDGDFMVDENELSQKITIDGTVASTDPADPGSNSDFVMQVVAFQLHNPFDYAVDLTDYYFQVGEWALDVKDDHPLLEPGQTRVVYATNPGREQIERRISDVAGVGASLDSWLSVQLGLQNTELDTHELERRRFLDVPSAPVIPIAEVHDFFVGDEGDNTPLQNRVVHMWREFGDPMLRTDDILADRMRDPAPAASDPTWDRRFELLDNEVDSALGGPEDRPVDEQFANTGLSITMFGSVRRPKDPGTDNPTLGIPRGAIPAFCIERKNGTRVSLNRGDDEGVADRDSLSLSDIRNAGHQTLLELFNLEGLTPLSNHHLPTDPSTNTDGMALDSTQHVLGPNSAYNYDRLYPEIHLANDEFNEGAYPNDYSRLRLADLLLPLAVGPKRYLNVPPGFGPAQLQTEIEWTTLSEALALATGYGNEPASPTLPTYFIGVDALDRGHLRTDAFVPYFKRTPPADFTMPWTFDPAPGQDEARYPGIPLAQHLLSQFRPKNFGSERRLVPGLININTAPLAVLRLLPMFTPERDAASPTGVNWLNDPNVARTSTGNTSLYPGPSATTPRYDIAAMVKAYRDKAAVDARGTQFRMNDVVTLDFSDDPSITPPEGRTVRTQIPGQREQAGFAGVGEVLSVMQRALDPMNRPTFDHATADLDNSIVRFGYAATANVTNETTAAITGIDSSVYSDTSGADAPDEIVNDYDEQLTIANAVLNTINTRSDVFCVWFVLHGYLPSDVEGLTNGDPMIPSFARRYIMVVDRSNVLNKGEKPRILLFQELPL